MNKIFALFALLLVHFRAFPSTAQEKYAATNNQHLKQREATRNHILEEIEKAEDKKVKLTQKLRSLPVTLATNGLITEKLEKTNTEDSNSDILEQIIPQFDKIEPTEAEIKPIKEKIRALDNRIKKLTQDLKAIPT